MARIAKEYKFVEDDNEFKKLKNFYEGRLNTNGLLTKASTVAAEAHKVLADPSVPSAEAVSIYKPRMLKHRKLFQQLRQTVAPAESNPELESIDLGILKKISSNQERQHALMTLLREEANRRGIRDAVQGPKILPKSLIPIPISPQSSKGQSPSERKKSLRSWLTALESTSGGKGRGRGRGGKKTMSGKGLPSRITTTTYHMRAGPWTPY